MCIRDRYSGQCWCSPAALHSFRDTVSGSEWSSSRPQRHRHGTGAHRAQQTVKKPSGGVGGAAAPLTFLRVSRLCRLRGSLILLAKSIPYKFGRPLVDRICFLEKVASATFSTRCGAPAFQRGRQGNAQPTAQFSRLSPQKNRATVPGPVWLPMVVPI